MMSKNLLRRALALEEVADGVAFREIEHVLYARVPNFEELKKAASSEHQEQWEIKIPKTAENSSAGSMRIRRTVKNSDQVEYVLTTKTVMGSEGDKLEVPIPTTLDNFQQFKRFSNRGMVKDRYFFPVEGTDLVWEVDMFYRPGATIGSGDYHEWCKIDLEVKDRAAPLPPLPIELTDVIAAPYGKRSEAEEAKVTSLYHNEFITKNEHAG
jgi:hypothetical protein